VLVAGQTRAIIEEAAVVTDPFPAPRVAEFFAGIGLVGMALEQEGADVVFANDISTVKRGIYAANFNGSQFVRCDVREIRGHDIPDVDLATASFPCTDTSLAGNRSGLTGQESGTLNEFLRVLNEMGRRRPFAVMLENVVGFRSSNDGRDLSGTIETLNGLGYVCDIVVLDGRWFLPQSRPRLFIVGSRERVLERGAWNASAVRPGWVGDFVRRRPHLSMQDAALPEPPCESGLLADFLEDRSPTDGIWWNEVRLSAFLESLSPVQASRLESRRASPEIATATAYRRTRSGRATWEIRADAIAGCLRTGRGGSSRQAVVEAGRGDVRVRWMTAREYARLQGAPDISFGPATESQARFALGDAVCVPAVAWLARHYLIPLVQRVLTRRFAVIVYG
jgi:DNA (cytosine-5)-methyltransferase 1